MVIQLTSAKPTKGRALEARHAYLLAAVCLVLGLAAGYSARSARLPAAAAAAPHLPPGHPALNARPSLEQLQQMANKQAAPLVQKLRADPKNADLLAQLGALYHSSYQYQQAATYYRRAVDADPKNVALHNKLSASLYRSGDVEAALAQLKLALSYDPKDANALFNMGLIEWEGKQDAAGALAAWKQLLKLNPQLAPERRATVEKLMAQAQAVLHPSAQN